MRGLNKRILSLVLAVAMFVGMMPVIAPAVVPEAKAVEVTVNDDTQVENYISMPITIRDFAADGMLFEWNELGVTLNDTSTINGKTLIHGNTLGYGLLMTNDKSKVNDLPLSDDAIMGTQAFKNESSSSSVAPDPVLATLNSGAKQSVYGALIRTNLVEGTLGANGKPVYTQATVDYVAKYMQQTLPEAEKNSSGQYQMWYVMGQKLSQLGGKDLATVLRGKIGSNMGTYAEAKAKFDKGGLRSYEDVASYYDAAYFLLHNTFSDSNGYGMTIPEYKTLDLVQKVKSDGTVYYTYNSAYDDSVYDTSSGRIYNSQTKIITSRETSSGGIQYARGNIQPEARFDPIGDLGYGKSSSTYVEYVNSSDLTNYYSKSNYNLTLEGHAQFIYYEDDNLYFNFTGDDDVYLYINGVRVLDLGGAHSIAKCGISLNSVANLCGLKDGGVYNFDFFYMERHGTAANFGIETNIKIVDPSMITNKTGYQNGTTTGYNGFVDPNKPVEYSFDLTNNGDADIQNLTFTDSDIGVIFTKDSITLNDESSINDMSAVVYNADGSVKVRYAAGALTEDILKELLETGLEIGEKIMIRGFQYNIETSDWVSGVFLNTVYTTAISIGDNNSTHNLNGVAYWKVQKANLVTEPFHVYDWLHKDVSKNPATVCNWSNPDGAVTVTKAELVKPVQDKGLTVPSNVTIVQCTASGSETASNQNPNVKVNSDNSITYTSQKPGVDTVYYKIKGMEYDDYVFRYDVFTYGTVNNIYVLDYGLAVELNGEDFGLTVNDTLTLDGNVYSPVVTMDVGEATQNYGTFTWNDPSLKYTPNDIIDDIDYVTVNLQLLEDGATELTKFTGVNMYEKVTTAPASVVYYEENFPGITYVNTDENNWVHYETVDDEGNTTAGTEQSADQDSNYGSDTNYEDDFVGTIISGSSVGTVLDRSSFKLDTTNLDTLQSSGVDALNQYLGLSGFDSNGTVNELVVNETAEVMFFEFKGTGFEIISRTTEDQYAVINVQVLKNAGDTDNDGVDDYTVVQQKPVITESKGGILYQVPIISITDLPKDEYRVVLKAAGSSGTKTRVLYIDGIRIYGPLEDGSALEYYNPEEYQAEIFEIKQMIENGQMIYVDVTDTDDELKMYTGITMIENVNEEEGGVLTDIESPEEYMKVGPNNEIYLDGNSGFGMIAFYLTPIESVPETARTLEIGAHRKADSTSDDDGYVQLTYGSLASEFTDTDYYYSVGSGTEMYYSIDVKNLILDTNGDYLVLIGTNGSENYNTTLALTNLKVSGYNISFAQTQVYEAYNDGDLEEISIISEPVKVYAARRAAMVPEETEPEVTEPEVTEPEVTEPEVTEPEVTEPEVTEPEVTEPEVTEPEVTEPEVTEPEVTEPEVTEPEVTEPEVTEPEVTEPEVTEPEATEPEVTEPEVTEPEVTEPETTLTVKSAALKVSKVVSGKVANITVKTTAEAASIVVTDAEGNEMIPVRSTMKASGDTVTFTFIWTVTGSRGDALDFTVRAYDSEGRPSLNEKTVTVTIK